MTEPMPEFHLGIIGGCMSHQRDTPLNALYHRRLAVMLEHDPGVRLRPHVARHFSLDNADRLEELLAGSHLDGLLVHLREVTIVSAARAFVTVSSEGERHRRLNPAMFDRGHRFRAERPALSSSSSNSLTAESTRSPDAYGGVVEDLQDLPLPGRRIAGFRLRNLTYMLGVMAGLGGWAIQDELLRFDDLAAACRQRGLPLFILGPTPATYSYWANRVTSRAVVEIRRHLSAVNVPCALIEQTVDGAGDPLIRADGFHMTTHGHRFVAEQLYEQGMRDWVRTILSGGQSRPAVARPR
jgi:hypothetical protein